MSRSFLTGTKIALPDSQMCRTRALSTRVSLTRRKATTHALFAEPSGSQGSGAGSHDLSELGCGICFELVERVHWTKSGLIPGS